MKTDRIFHITVFGFNLVVFEELNLFTDLRHMRNVVMRDTVNLCRPGKSFSSGSSCRTHVITAAVIKQKLMTKTALSTLVHELDITEITYGEMD